MATSICDKLRAGVTTGSAEETQTLAAAWAATLPADVIIALHGDMGVGKTTFVQGLARGFGVKGNVTSPTFAIYAVYHGRRTLIHLDAYRLETAREIEDLLLEDFLDSPYCLAIEWPERIAAWIAPEALHVDLGITPDERHTVRLR
ncbi:MAG: tRNA (adenosine(37)-N6)-threonylcarbamoyltransferase complex ATPase subunit type 1 TsaE [Opitutaceae bacterium]|nr:tRNA (adenosine(37)-N6)-threonylcarbamoyltransferase complex ATPase subunit type 1 TsaE [Opitutaceae bacterium]